MNWFLERLKAFAAVVTPLITAAILKGVEQATGFDIPNDLELTIIAGVTGVVVHQTPNKPAASK
jgi:hypothetical protein